MINKMKEQDVKNASSGKREISTSVPLQTILSSNDHLPFWNMDDNMVIDIALNKMITQFQLGYISVPSSKQNKSFKEKVEKIISSVFSGLTMKSRKNC